MARPYLGAILAAGRGTRMAPFGETLPKAALPIGNRPLIAYQIEQMRELGIAEIVVVIGHRGYEVTKILGDGERFGVHLHYKEQTTLAGLAHAVGCLEPLLSSPFLLMLGDIFFLPRDLRDMFLTFEAHEAGAVLAAKIEEDQQAIRKNFAILEDAERRVRRVIEKPRHPQNNLKGVGLYLFDPVVFDAIRRTPRTAMRDEYELTDAIQVMIDDGHDVRVSECVADDINLTSPADLLRCNLIVAASGDHSTLVAPSAKLHPAAILDRSIVGKRAVIENPITIRRSVVLDGSVVTSTLDLDSCVVSPTQVVDCRAEISQWLAGFESQRIGGGWTT